VDGATTSQAHQKEKGGESRESRETAWERLVITTEPGQKKVCVGRCKFDVCQVAKRLLSGTGSSFKMSEPWRGGS